MSGHSPLSTTLVGIQFAAAGAYLWLAGTTDWAAWPVALLVLSALVGSAALLANRPGNFNIRPEPKQGARLIRHGIYRYIRHPMYTSLLLAGLAVTVATPSVVSIVLWCVLLATLLAKALLEERWMSAAYPDYLDYKARTKRFVPWIV